MTRDPLRAYLFHPPGELSVTVFYRGLLVFLGAYLTELTSCRISSRFLDFCYAVDGASGPILNKDCLYILLVRQGSPLAGLLESTDTGLFDFGLGFTKRGI